MRNALAAETSPYLLQHADNPVAWMPWGAEALERAQRENKPIFLSIGYAACHWCHVMAHESFEDADTAALLNEHFVPIKVDREERPDVDSLYMDAVVSMTGHGGWPTSIFLTPDGKPFFAGTYFPPEPRHGLPAFREVLLGVARAWRENRAQLLDSAGRVAEQLAAASAALPPGAELRPETLDEAAEGLWRTFDAANGGWGTAPKFPAALAIEVLLRRSVRSRDVFARDLAVQALEAMAAGGIHDQLGGGFHRYSVDAAWTIPHFEKMLYDNALLIPLYLEAWQATGAAGYRRIAEETVAYVRREMLQPGGGFYASQDADSEGEEGRFFVWTRDEVVGILGTEAGEVFCQAYDVTDGGNVEGGRNVLNVRLYPEGLAERFGETPETIEAMLAEGRRRLLEARERRPRPFRDEKVLTAWNGLMLSAFARAAQVLEDGDALAAAEQSAAFLWKELRRDGRLMAAFKDGRARIPGYLDDYAFLAQAFLDLFETTFDPSCLERAVDLAEGMLDLFWNGEAGGFYLTGKDHERLIVRPTSSADHAIPSGCAVAALDLLRLHSLTGRETFRERAERTLAALGEPMAKNPFGFAGLLLALDFHAETPKQIVIVGDPAAAETKALLRAVRRTFLPYRMVVAARPGEDLGALPHVGDLLKGRAAAPGPATAYVCHRFACSLPVTAPAELAALLAPAQKP